MSEYWKSTPSYWCKFCSQYVRDTGIERKNHEASAKHQNSIQRSLRELHKGKEREDREKQRAKDEVARLNGMFSGDKGPTKSAPAPAAEVAKASASAPAPAPAAPTVATAQQRRAHAEQLAALGVELPEELRKEVTGVGSYQVVNERKVQQTGSISVNRSLAEILAEAKREEDQEEEGVEEEKHGETESKRVHKRKADDDDDPRDEEAAPKQRKAWGSNLKTYPGSKDSGEDVGDLDALLSGIKKPKTEAPDPVKKEEGVDNGKDENDMESSKPLSAIPDINEEEKEGTDGAAAAPAVVFKKRKGKK